MGANGTCWNAVPFSIVPALGKVSEHSSHVSVSKETWDVLHEHVAGSKVANGSDVFRPEPGSCSINACAFPGEAEVLTGEAPAQKIDSLNGRPVHGGDVSISLDSRPMLSEDAPAIGIDFNLPLDFTSCPF